MSEPSRKPERDTEKADARRERFRKIDEELKREIGKNPEDLGTLSDRATQGGGGEPLGENFAPETDERKDAA